MAVAQPRRAMTTAVPAGAVARVGRTQLGTVSIADGVVSKIAARAAAENPDAGAAAVRMLGRTVPGAGHLGLRGTDLGGLPKTSVDVDGSKAFLTLEISVPLARVRADGDRAGPQPPPSPGQ